MEVTGKLLAERLWKFARKISAAGGFGCVRRHRFFGRKSCFGLPPPTHLILLKSSKHAGKTHFSDVRS